jgi:hypothetical protein
MNKSGIRYVSTIVSVGLVSLALVHCSSSSSGGGSLDGGSTGGGGGGSGSSTTGGGGTNTTTGGGGSGVNCTPAAGDSACTMCLKASCCGETQACATNMDCYNLLMCYANCTTADCISGCDMQFPGGTTLLNTLLQCSQTKCGAANQCGG